MWLVDFLFYIIFCAHWPTSGLTLELHTEDKGQCYNLTTTNFYDEANFTIVLDNCEVMSFGRQKISCHGENTLKVQFFENNDNTCSSPSKTYIVEKGACYAASSGERMMTDTPTVSPTRSPIWDTLNFDTNCSYEELEQQMYGVIDINLNAGQWVDDCLLLARTREKFAENGTYFNSTHLACRCFGPLSSDDAWELINCKLTPQFNGMQVWAVCNNIGYSREDLYGRRRYQEDSGSFLDVDWDHAQRLLFQRLSAADDVSEAVTDLDWDSGRRRLFKAIGGDEYISLTWEDDTCSDTCVCSEDYNNDLGYGYFDAAGNCQCGILQLWGMTCDKDWIYKFPDTEMGNNPWSQGVITFVINQCTRDLDSPYDGQYRKVSCSNWNTNLLFQFYNDDPTCTDEFASATISEQTCYNYSLLAQGSTDSPTLAPTKPTTWPLLNYSNCADYFKTKLTQYVLNERLDIVRECSALLTAPDQTEETVACPCLSQLPKSFALEHMNCNITDTHNGLEVWGYCKCIGYPDCVTRGDCLKDCPYNPLCPDGLDGCTNNRRRIPKERRRIYGEDTFQVLGINLQCSAFSPYPTLVPTTLSPTRAPSRFPSYSPTTPYPTTASPTESPTTPLPTSYPTTASPTISPTTPWPTLQPTSSDGGANVYGLIFLEMDKRDELLMFAIMMMTSFCLVFFLYKVFLERRLKFTSDSDDSEEEEVFDLSDENEHFHMSTEDNTESSLKLVST